MWIPHFPATSTPVESLFLGLFRRLSRDTPLSDFCCSYQNALRITIWLFFLFVYSQAGTRHFPCFRRLSYIVETVREPLDRLDPLHRHVDVWEFILYLMGLAFTLEGASIPS
jgi:hypothetical protein